MDFFKYHFDRLSEEERRSFLTRKEYAGLCEEYDSAEAIAIIEDKRAFSAAFADHLGRAVLPVPSEDWETTFRQMRLSFDALLFKPQNGGYGKGLRRFNTSDEAAVQEVLETLRRDGGLVEEFLSQDPVLASFHPESVNTIRSLTVIDREGRPRLIAAALRTGMHHSECDNLGGGLFAAVDLETGVLSTDATTHFGGTFSKHPDTGVPFRGTALPHWDDFLRATDRAALALPGLTVCCWDWALRDNGTWCLIEGNVKGGLGLLQEAEGRGLKRSCVSQI